MANGVSAICCCFSTSFCTFLLIPLFLLKFPFNNEKPELAIMIPPAIRKAVIVIPKKDKTYCPTKKEISNMTQTFMEVTKD